MNQYLSQFTPFWQYHVVYRLLSILKLQNTFKKDYKTILIKSYKKKFIF